MPIFTAQGERDAIERLLLKVKNLDAEEYPCMWRAIAEIEGRIKLLDISTTEQYVEIADMVWSKFLSGKLGPKLILLRLG